MLRRIFYVSEIDSTTTLLDIRVIVSSSSVWNRRHDVTGILIASRSNFAQVIECKPPEMALVMARIRSDRRHRSIRVQSDYPVELRLFGRWSMVFVQRDDLSDELSRLHASDDETVLKGVMLDELAKVSRDFDQVL